jgi:hypothetical protein
MLKHIIILLTHSNTCIHAHIHSIRTLLIVVAVKFGSKSDKQLQVHKINS